MQENSDDLVMKQIGTSIDLEFIKSQLLKNGKFKLPGFGTLWIKRKKQHEYTNQAGEVVTIPPRKVVTFRSARELNILVNSVSDAVNSNEEQQ
jgi:nucleoid DNA-binding protein